MKAYITGYGIISSIGNDSIENLTNLRNNNSGIDKSNFLDSIYSEKLLFGEVKLSNLELANRLSLDGSNLSRTDLLALTACQEAINMSKLTQEQLSDYSTSLVSSSTVGGMSETTALYEDANLKSTGSNFLYTYGSGIHTQVLAKHFLINGITDTINTACSSSANAIMIGALLIKTGRAKRVIVGGVDSISKFTVNGFNSLQILSNQICRPFDINRRGLNLGEGAGYLILESEEVVGSKKIFGVISGYGNFCDSFHQTALSDNAIGVIKAIEQAISVSKLEKSDIDYINAHGTATLNNDDVESFGIRTIFKNIPPINSTKSYTGHTLAAAGAIEAIYSIFSINNGEVYKSLNCTNPINNIPLVQENLYNLEIKHVLSNSFGFGGNCTSLVISKS